MEKSLEESWVDLGRPVRKLLSVWTKHILVSLGAGWIEEGEGEEEVFQKSPEFLACLTGGVAVLFYKETRPVRQPPSLVVDS